MMINGPYNRTLSTEYYARRNTAPKERQHLNTFTTGSDKHEKRRDRGEVGRETIGTISTVNHRTYVKPMENQNRQHRQHQSYRPVTDHVLQYPRQVKVKHEQKIDIAANYGTDPDRPIEDRSRVPTKLFPVRNPSINQGTVKELKREEIQDEMKKCTADKEVADYAKEITEKIHNEEVAGPEKIENKEVRNIDKQEKYKETEVVTNEPKAELQKRYSKQETNCEKNTVLENLEDGLTKRRQNAADNNDEDYEHYKEELNAFQVEEPKDKTDDELLTMAKREFSSTHTSSEKNLASLSTDRSSINSREDVIVDDTSETKREVRVTINETSTDGESTVYGEIANTQVRMLIDSGAAISAISEKLFNETPSLRHSELQQTQNVQVQSVNGQPLKIIGLITLQVGIGGLTYKLQAHIIQDLHYEVVLGRDFLKEHGAQIDFAREIVRLARLTEQSSTFPKDAARTDQQLNPSTVAAAAVYVIPPLTETVFPVKIIGDLPTGIQGYVEPDERLASRLQVIGATVLASISQEKTVPFRVINPTSTPVTIYRNTTLGAFYPSLGVMATIELEEPSKSGSSIAEDEKESKNTAEQVPIQCDNTSMTTEQQSALQKLINEHRDVFALNPEELGCTSLVKHHIDTENNPPIRRPPYRTSPEQRQRIDTHVQEMLERGIIEPSNSAWSAPVVLVKKRDGTDRFCVDYRKLNAVTRKDSYPLPRTDDVLDALHGAQYFTSLDLMSGYHQVKMEEDSRDKTAFVTHSGLFQFLVLPFGLCNAPSTFQRLIECMLRGLNWKICLLYLDDIIIFSKTFQEHIEHIKLVFGRLRAANVKLKPSKCYFASHKVEFLGHVVSREGVQPNESKINVVKDYPRPRNVTDVRAFLGLCNYYRRFVQGFAKMAAPLNQLTRKAARFTWTEDHQLAFDKLKTALTTTPILAFPDFKEEFHLFVDASQDAIGITLGQIQHGKERVIAYGGRNLSETERKYSTTEREALAVVFGIKKCRPYLYGRKFTVHTDHHSLRWLMNTKHETGRLARWALTLQEYDFEIVHRSGASNGNADALSRRSYHEHIAGIVSQESTLPLTRTLEQVKQLQKRDPDLGDLITYLETDKLPAQNNRARPLMLIQDQFYLDDNGLLFHIWMPSQPVRHAICYQLVIPQALRFEVLLWGHDDVTAGHLGVNKTYAKLRQRYYWRGMFRDIEHWCRSCTDCAMRKQPKNRARAPLLPIPVEGAFDRVAVDCLGPFPPTHSGNSYIVVFSDYLTRWPEAFAVPTIDAPVIARLFVEELLLRHGAPRTLLSDKGTNFLSSLLKEVCKIVNTKKVQTTAYHPQCDGVVERFNGTLAQSLSMYVSSDQKDWDTYLTSVLFAYRVSPQASTLDSPFYLLYGREPRLPMDVSLLAPSKLSNSVEEHRRRIVTQINEAQNLARINLQKTQQKMKTLYDRNTKPVTFDVGDKVWVYTPKPRKGLSKKLRHFWFGPYRITKKMSPVHFELTTCDNRKVSTSIHANRMKPFIDPNERPIAPPEEDNDEPYLCHEDLPPDSYEEVTETEQTAENTPQHDCSPSPCPQETTHTNDDIYEIDRIIKEKKTNGQTYFLIKWKGYGTADNTWEPEENIFNKSLIENFRRQKLRNRVAAAIQRFTSWRRY